VQVPDSESQPELDPTRTQSQSEPKLNSDAAMNSKEIPDKQQQQQQQHLQERGKHKQQQQQQEMQLTNTKDATLCGSLNIFFRHVHCKAFGLFEKLDALLICVCATATATALVAAASVTDFLVI